MTQPVSPPQNPAHWDVATYVDDLVPGVWPRADVRSLRTQAQQCRVLADRVRGVADDVQRVRTVSVLGAGLFVDEADAGVSRLTAGSASRTTGHLYALAGRLDRYADLVVSSRREMTAIATIVDRDSRRADMLSMLGDDSARVVTASAGRMALTAAGDDFTDRSDDAGRNDHQMPPPAATSGMMPFAPLGALGAGAIAAVSGRAGRAGADHAVGIATTDLVWLRRRADRLAATVDESVGGWLRTAIGVGVSASGRRVVVVGTNDPQPYQRRGMTLADDEAFAADGREPELAILDHMTRTGATVQAVASATPIAPDVLAVLTSAEVAVLAPGVERPGC